ncbi:hypothetical protein PMG11_11251 [Penicillium brasilianum]|uniref:Uncharacterized protein n=1 Tax=Penicillium brasilianum TaxID=104259 RepID=A0A0F7U4T9_PENBI|nr:hypothetical protein PMG11_11251 [Penicillium brasilianum]
MNSTPTTGHDKTWGAPIRVPRRRRRRRRTVWILSLHPRHLHAGDLEFPVIIMGPSSARSYKTARLESYSCDVCASQFSRADHLARHYRSHTRQRPFICSVCRKGFARRDLMTRHQAKHAHDKQTSSTASAINGFTYRVAQACKRCAASKLKCTDEKPCPRCLKKNIPCEIPDNVPVQGPAVSEDTQSHSCPTDSKELGGFAPDHAQTACSDEALPIDDIPMLVHEGGNPASLSESLLLGVPDADALWTMASFFDMSDQNTDPKSVGDLTDLQDMDFSFLDELTAANETIIWDPESPAHKCASIISASSQVYSTSSVARTWVPLPTENASMERGNLTFAGDTHELPAKGIAEHVSLQLIAPAARDRILNMVFAAYPEKTGPIIEDFPSAEILSKLVYRYISQRKVEYTDFMHLPTFEWKSRRPELLAAIIALGSIDGPSATVRKFGYALQATVRRATIQRYEENHAKMRDMDLAQAYLIQQYIAFFSGISRKIGLAESCSMITSTIISQARMLLQGSVKSVEAALAADSIEQLDPIWRRWSQQECIRRVIYYSYTLDSQVSITRKLNPILPYTDMDTPLPCSDSLWRADTPAAWKQELIARITPQPTSLLDLLRSPRLLRTRGDCLDSPFVHMVYVSGLWSIVQEYRRLSSIASVSSSWNRLVMMSRQGELATILERFGKDSIEVRREAPGVDLLYNLVSMHLYVSFKELQPVVSNGKDQSCNQVDQTARAHALEWRQDAGSRFAVWFAGQVVRAARAFHRETLCDVYTIGLLQATVVLWVYGNLSDSPVGPGPPVMSPIMELNETDPLGLDNYLCDGQGQPGLNVPSQGFVPLSDSWSVVEAVKGILQQNWRQSPFPSGTDEVYQVLSDLQTTSSIQGQ